MRGFWVGIRFGGGFFGLGLGFFGLRLGSGRGFGFRVGLSDGFWSRVGIRAEGNRERRWKKKMEKRFQWRWRMKRVVEMRAEEYLGLRPHTSWLRTKHHLLGRRKLESSKYLLFMHNST